MKKFKAWDKSRKVMCLPHYDSEGRACVFYKNIMHPLGYLLGTGNYAKGFDLLEYLGIKDENEIDVCESDIVETNRPGGYSGVAIVVKTPLGGFHLKETVFNNGEKSFTTKSGVRNIKRIIGNIYENKELLT